MKGKLNLLSRLGKVQVRPVPIGARRSGDGGLSLRLASRAGDGVGCNYTAREGWWRPMAPGRAHHGDARPGRQAQAGRGSG